MTQYLTGPVRRASLFTEDRFKTRSNPALNTSTDDLKEESEDDSSSSGDPDQESNAVINIRIGGSLFCMYERTLQCIPKLAKLDKSSSHYICSRDEYFFDRNPGIFQNLLDYHRLGEVHIPKTLSAKAVQEELQYWGLDDTCLAKCCKKYFHDSLHEENTNTILQQQLEDLHNNVYLCPAESDTSRTSLKCLSTWKNYVWQFFNESHSSITAKMWEILYLFLVVVSIATLFMETLPSCRTPVYHHNHSDNGSSQENEHAHNRKITMFMDTQPHLALRITDISCLVFFTIEFCLRMFVCPAQLRLLKKALTIFDLLYLIPAWFGTITDWVDDSFWHSSDRMHGLIILLVLKVLRVFRLARFVRHVRGLKILCLALKASTGELFLLAVLFIMAITIFAPFIYCAELSNPNSFDSAFRGLWWAVITMTTVGYGDYYPESGPGYIVASICALTGIILNGLVVPIITSNFLAYYNLRPLDETPVKARSIEVKNKKKRKRRKKKKKSSAKVHPT